jgi:hypothetical protein
MSNSFEEWLREVASSVGLTEEQLAKAVGAVVLNSIYAGIRPPKPKCREAVLQILKAKRVVKREELASAFSAGEVEDAVRELEAQGEVCEVDTYAYGKLVAVADDGTLNLAGLADEEKAAAVSTAYANRSIGLTYRTALEHYRKNRRLLTRTNPAEEILELLKTGPKRYVELVRSGLPKSQIYPALKTLTSEGKVRKLARGKYSLASRT